MRIDRTRPAGNSSFLGVMGRPQRVLLIRIGEYDVTPALARFVSVLRAMEHPPVITVMCWGHRQGSNTGSKPPGDVRLIRHQAYATSRASIASVWAISAWCASVFLELLRGRYDLVQPSDVISMVPCIIARPLLRFAFVVDVRDAVRSVSKTHLSWRAELLGYVEALGMRMADRVIIVGEDQRKYLPPLVLSKHREIVVRNLPEKDLGTGAARRAVKSDSVRICFSGYLSNIRGSDMLLRAAAACSYLIIDAVGDPNREDLKDQLRHAEKVVTHGRVSRDRALEIMAESDLVALLYDPRIELNRHASPNKFYEALMLGRPIVTCFGTAMAKAVSEFGCGYLVEYNDVEGLLGVIDAVRRNPQGWMSRSLQSRRLFTKSCQWGPEAEKLRKAYRDMLGCHRLGGIRCQQSNEV
jgi:glycosyltransferase involved in cell wall biosynthesis